VSLTACVGTVPQARATSVIAPVFPEEAATTDVPKVSLVILSTSAYKAVTLASHTELSYEAAVGSGTINKSIDQVLLAVAVRILVVLFAVVVVFVAAVVFVVLAAVVFVAAVVLFATATTGAGAGRYLDGELQYPPKASVTLSLARVKPLARAQQILKTTSLFLIASIYFEKVYLRATGKPPLFTDVTEAAAEVYECPALD